MIERGLAFLLMLCGFQLHAQQIIDGHGALIRSDTTQNTIYLCFTGHEFIDGFDHVLYVLDKHHIKASFFLTGDFVRQHKKMIQDWAASGHYIGAHSDRHLLYNAWENRDSLRYTKAEIKRDIENNLLELKKLNLDPTYFMPPYEWYNKEIVALATALGQTTVNFSPGTRSNADYTTPEMDNYMSSEDILNSIYSFEKEQGMNGFHLLIHPGTSDKRKDKLYHHLETLILHFKERGYAFARFK
ncbi:polysaccharide deacetylase family protein [Maribacter sp. 2307ULW6-5]|uniref:polysaccharide deacetylase family protein n=1 Tax=Maribacter sp. 2307ULW6-5 TaxID=3386275 RepID=UPI0039BD8CB6